jgi:hypothetical protein
MNGRRPLVLPCLLLALAMSAAIAAPARPLPVSAHNCYPQDSGSNARVLEALALGIDNIEIDLGWDAVRQRLIVGHDERPRPGATYPDLESYLVPALAAHWKNPRRDSAPTVLTIDWKTAEPAAVRRFHEFLDTHAEWFSTAPKAADSRLTTRRLTVCFTGSDAAKDLYDALVPAGSVYRAFRDQVFGAGRGFRADVAAYVPNHATSYCRFLTFYWGHVERGGPPFAGAWTDSDAARLKALIARSHQQGFHVRFYALNGHTASSGPYRFSNDAAARLRWRAAAEAGADWVATDEYAEIVAVLGGTK